jgi:tetratricopeptide (TPR) repeat protein
MRRALELDPDSEEALGHYAIRLRALGRYCESVEPAERALRLDPLSPGAATGAGASLFECGRPEEGIARYRQALALDANYQPALRSLASALGRLGRHEDAVEQVLKAERLAGWHDETIEALRRAFRSGGFPEFRKARAREQLQRLRQAALTRRLSPRAWAETHTEAGDLAQAFFWLEEAYRQRCPTLALIKSQHQWEPLRTDPGYHGLLRRMALN